MKRRSPPISADDTALFREAIGPVRRIETPTLAGQRPPPEPTARRFEMDEAQALRESREPATELIEMDPAQLLGYRRSDVPERSLKQLKRGQYSVLDEIDLHHLRANEAESVLKAFLADARQQSHFCVRIIHGKGLRSENMPVLKQLVDRLLRQRHDVLAFASAPANQGGSGAVLVLLARTT